MKINAIGIISASYKTEDFGILTNKRPVASLPFAGRYRLIDFPISNMANSGITTVGIVTPHYYRSILDHVGIGKPWGLARNTGGLFMLPGTIYGTREVGSRFLLKDLMRNRIFLERASEDYVIFTDSSKIMNFDMRPLIKAHAESGLDITMLYVKTNNQKGGQYLTIDETSGEVTNLTDSDKATENRFLDCFVTSKEFLLSLIDWYGSRSTMDLTDIFKLNIRRYSIGSYEYKDYVGIISDVNDFMKVNRDMLKDDIRKELFGNAERPIITKVLDAPPTLYEPTADVSNSLISSGCIIEGTVENSIIFRNVRVMPGAVVKDAIVMQHVTVEKDAYIENMICDKYVNVSEGVRLKGGRGGPLIAGKGEQL
ncbi:MAG: glucose-1-phosphate adenylyltransferase subunit GlgD [Firmicutes bacterium]|nr:glucose-1-phosphate adenylyltransferase subunit GlgD [Bacillota bacterium]